MELTRLQTSSASGGAAPSVCIVIPAYRQASIRDCLESIKALDGDGVSYEIRVVLNDVFAEIRESVRGSRPPVIIHDMPMNLGVGGAYNLAFASSRSEYMLGLQDDSIVEPGLLRHLLQRVASAPDIGAAAALVTDLDGQVWDAGWAIWGDGLASPVWSNGSRDPADHPACRSVPHHGTMGMMIRRAAWESLGGFDDAFYPLMYGDVDTSIGLRRRGWRVVVDPTARARQAVNSSTTPPYAHFLLERHRQLLLQKHGAWLAQAPPHSAAPEDVAREFERVATLPTGPTPPSANGTELALLQSRLARTPAQVLRWERDLLADYRRHLEAHFADVATANDSLTTQLAATAAANDSLTTQLAATDRQLQANQIWAADLDRQLQELSVSRSMRVTAPMRGGLARIRRLRD